jgi:hypothetical protein
MKLAKDKVSFKIKLAAHTEAGKLFRPAAGMTRLFKNLWCASCALSYFPHSAFRIPTSEFLTPET